MKLTHSQIEELLGAYALDAVEPDEADAVELHLRECPRCRAEVADHREVAAVLAYGGAAAPDGVWSRIAGALEETPPKLDLARMDLRRKRRLVPARVVTALAAAAAAVIGLLGVQVARQDARLNELAAAVGTDGLDEAVRAALLDESAHKVSLRSDDGRISADAIVQPDGRAFLVRHNLPHLPDTLTYQLWALAGDRTVSVGVLGSAPRTSAFTVDPEEVSVLAVTAEQAGGAPAPTNDPLLRGFLPV